ncbi:MAG: hypothetical protein AAFU33_22300 [Bacteroidota bacterium]
MKHFLFSSSILLLLWVFSSNVSAQVQIQEGEVPFQLGQTDQHVFTDEFLSYLGEHEGNYIA